METSFTQVAVTADLVESVHVPRTATISPTLSSLTLEAPLKRRTNFALDASTETDFVPAVTVKVVPLIAETEPLKYASKARLPLIECIIDVGAPAAALPEPTPGTPTCAYATPVEATNIETKLPATSNCF